MIIRVGGRSALGGHEVTGGQSRDQSIAEESPEGCRSWLDVTSSWLAGGEGGWAEGGGKERSE